MKKTVSRIILTLLIACMSMFVLSTLPIEAEPTTITYQDDFSTNSGMWEYLGSAYRDPTNQYLVLTEPINNQGGVAFFNTTFRTSFTANFSYKAGGGSGADGFVMFFYKQKYSTIGYGGGLGFSMGTINPIPGYGIEFDNWRNLGLSPGEHLDPSANHVALIKDHVGNHLIYIDDLRTEDNSWHSVSVIVEDSTVRVMVDQGLVFQWEGTIDRTYDYFGFSGGTGSATNWHIIDNFTIEIHTPTPPAVTATLDIDPDTLNLRSKGKWITAYIELPEGYDVNNINISSIMLNNTIPAELTPFAIGDYDEDSIPDLMVKFNRTEVVSLILANVNIEGIIEGRFATVTLTITGKLNNGTPFQGSNTIRVVFMMPRCWRFIEFC